MHRSLKLLWTTAFLGACSVTPPATIVPPAGIVPELADTRWALVEILSMDDSRYRPSSPEAYTLEFDGDHVSVRADCNRGRGAYESERPGHLLIGRLAMTRAYCGTDSLHDRFVSDLSYVRSYVLRGGHLHLATMADGAILEFRPFDGPGAERDVP